LALSTLGGPGAGTAGRPPGRGGLRRACRGPYTPDASVDDLCEAILLEAGEHAEAYRRYGTRANRAGTYLATFRATARAYPQVAPADLLHDLVQASPSDEGKWFAAAKEAGLYGEALALAASAPCDPRTLTRAARDLAATQPAFALEAGLLAMHWVAMGHGYEITTADVYAARAATLHAGDRLGLAPAAVVERIREAVAAGGLNNFAAQVLGRELGA